MLGDRTADVLRDLYTEAGWAGIAAGRSQLRTAAARKMVTKSEVDWEGWTPGNPEAAAKLIGTIDAPGLKNLLDGANVTINGIQQTRYDELAGILARSVGSGLGVDETAKMIDEYFSKGMDWAEVVARTETARAVTAGTLDSYAEGGVEQVEWLTADGGCEICGEFESMGAVPMDDGFGDVEGPPAHPNCLCTLLPVVVSDFVAPSSDDAVDEVDELAGSEGVTEDVTQNELVSITPTSAANHDFNYFIDNDYERLKEIGREFKSLSIQRNETFEYVNEELMMKQILKDQGFADLPTVVDSEKFEKLRSDTDYKYLARGVTGKTQAQADAYAESFRSGDLYAGRGMFGSGTYTSDNSDVLEHFTTMTASGEKQGGGAAIEMLIKPDAKIIDYADIYPQMSKDTIKRNSYFNDGDPLYVIQDRGRWAAANGYDVIRVPNPEIDGKPIDSDYWIVLNRTSVIVKEGK